ncbi:MAG: TIGR01777 family oxidoreductase [Pirellulales bacterium]
MHVLVSGSTGLVGSALVPFLKASGHRVTRLVRSSLNPPGDALFWDPSTGIAAKPGLGEPDAVVHLAGENIAGRWTDAKKARIHDSRVAATRILCESLARLPQPPRVLISASAVGYYGDRGDELLDEQSEPGAGFLAEVCRQWEAATSPAADQGVRVVNLRLGVVLSTAGGALAKMLLPFRLGLGGRLGSGRQYTSWITLEDLVGVIRHALTAEALRGPVNAVAPHAVTSLEFTKTLGRVLGRPTLLPVPAAALRWMLGEMADAMLLAGARVEPRRLLAAGYVFHDPELEPALRRLLGKAG